MKDTIQIVNFLLTRRCNLQCSYCGIARNTNNRLKHFYENEVNTERVIKFLEKLKKHNPNSFVIWYGGEPLLRNDLAEIIRYCNFNDINYTIITNNTDIIQKRIKKLIYDVGYLQGLTSSVDPYILLNKKDDITIKSNKGLLGLIKFKKYVKDLVAEITVDKNTINNLYNLVKILTDNDISSSITFLDIAKSEYYDFSNVKSSENLVYPTEELKEILKRILDENLNVHMKDLIYNKIYDILPSNLKCYEDNKNIHNLTVDADGSIRCCLRIQGSYCPTYNTIENVFDENYNVSELYKMNFENDYKYYCKGCNWTCMLFSDLLSRDDSKLDDLLHSEKRS